MRSGAAVVVGLSLALAAAGCADQSADEQGIEVPGLTATLEQYREDEINGWISVKTSNASGSESSVELRDLRLVAPGFAATEPYERSTLISPGVRFDVRVMENEATCGDPPLAEATLPSGAAFALGQASIDGAEPVLVRVPVDDVLGILPKVFSRSCAEQRLRWAADLRFGDGWTPTTTAAGDPAMSGSIELRRLGADEPLTVTDVNGSVLLRITAADPAGASGTVATLAADDAELSIPITVEQSGNCSPHALTESKKTFIIPIGFAIGDEEPLVYVITFDVAARGPLNEMINDSCGLG